MAYLRRKENNCVLVILNLSKDTRAKIDVEHPWLAGRFKNIFSDLVFQFDTKENFELQEGEYIVYEKII